MPTYRQEEKLSFKRIEKSAVKALLEEIARQESVERKSGPCELMFSERPPACNKQFVGILDSMDLRHVFGVVEQIVAIECPLIEGGSVVVRDRAIVEQQRRPTQAMQHDAIFS